jgi:hypothetical protein
MLAFALLRLQNTLLARTVWFLDFDGSLCPHLEVWQQRTYDPAQIAALVSDLARAARGVFWNTGRRVESLGSVNEAFLEHSGYFMQGAARWDAKSRQETLVGVPLPEGYEPQIRSLLASKPRFRLEVKRASLRVAPFVETEIADLRALFLDPVFPRLPGWTWHVGARGAELLHDSFDKGHALRAEMKRFPADSLPVAVGDDLLDKPAVEAALAMGGYAILVGENCGWATEIPHLASQLVVVRDPDEALSRIRALLAP